MSSLRSKRIGILQRIKNSGLGSAAGPLGPAVRTPRRAAGPSRQHQDAASDRPSFPPEGHTDGDDQRRTDLAPVSESRKTHSEPPRSTVTHTRQLGAQVRPNTGP
ncbi:hypothetical protein AMELA_G00281250 [Ameiurus melas]|uniref:Uncharacterized protein n=1 Tax=Ameiurus melas TaxID=219545 RepID=A0A7J5ZKC5_AMEME|nr:hypothetical protein AMELA_G00281250 [Ameiurus melas]